MDAPDPPLSIGRLERAEMLTLTIAGEIDAARVDELKRAVLDAGRETINVTKIELNMHGVDFVDAAGIKALLLSRAELDGLHLRVVRPSPAVTRLFRMTGTDGDLLPGD